MSQLIRYARSFVIMLGRGLPLSIKLLTQGLMEIKLKSILWTLYAIMNWLIDQMCLSHS